MVLTMSAFVEDRIDVIFGSQPRLCCKQHDGILDTLYRDFPSKLFLQSAYVRTTFFLFRQRINIKSIVCV